MNIGGSDSEKKNRLDGYDTVCEKTVNETILLLYLLLKNQHFYDFFLALKEDRRVGTSPTFDSRPLVFSSVPYGRITKNDFKKNVRSEKFPVSDVLPDKKSYI